MSHADGPRQLLTRRAAIAAAWLATVALSGCGPGVGGSGTGLEPDAVPPTTSPPPAAPPPPVAGAYYADTTDRTRVQLRFVTGGIQLDLSCPRLQFVGEPDPARPGSYIGTTTDASIGATPRPARVDTVLLSASSLTLTLTQSEPELVLLSPLTLSVDPVPAPLGACG